MATRVVEWRRPYTWWKAITVDENRVISLNLRWENNLIIWDEWDNEIYVDLQLPDWRTPQSTFPVWVTTGRVASEDGWDVTGTIISAKTTSWDNVQILYGDNWTLWIDNGSWTFKQIYFKWDVDTIVALLQNQIDVLSGLGKFLSLWDCVNGEPMSFPLETPYEYSTWDYYLIGNVSSDTPPVNYRPAWDEWIDDDPSTKELESATVERWDTYIYDWTVWLLQKNTATWWTGTWDVSWPDSAVDWHLALFDWSTGKIIKDWWVVPEWVPSGWNNWDVLTNVSWTPTWQAPSWWGSTIEYATQAEYTALLPWAESDGKHYFIYHEAGGWQPWANTLVYLPLEWDVDDYSWNWNNWAWKAWSSAWTPDYATLSTGKVVAKINWTWGTGSSSNISITIPTYQTAPKTISVWMYKCSSYESWFNEQNAGAWKYFMWQLASDWQNWWAFRLTGNYNWNPYCWYQCWDWSDSRIFAQHNYIWQWQHLVATCDNTNTSYYINWVLKGSLSKVIQANADLFMWVAPFEYSSSSPEVRFFWYFSEVILEDIAWTATDITKYYNDTKAQYWIS